MHSMQVANLPSLFGDFAEAAGECYGGEGCEVSQFGS